MSEWKPIETAPKDGTEILIWYGGMTNGVMATFRDEEWMVPDEYPNGWTGLLSSPTHWMPLPAPPGAENSHP